MVKTGQRYETFEEVKRHLKKHGPYATIVSVDERFECVKEQTNDKKDKEIMFDRLNDSLGFCYMDSNKFVYKWIRICYITSIEPSSKEALGLALKFLRDRKEKLDKESCRINTLIGKVMSKKAEAALEGR